jgi:hypothetical protein
VLTARSVAERWCVLENLAGKNLSALLDPEVGTESIAVAHQRPLLVHPTEYTAEAQLPAGLRVAGRCRRNQARPNALPFADIELVLAAEAPAVALILGEMIVLFTMMPLVGGA